MFITSVETIKSSNGQFPNVVPLSVRKEIYEKFCISSSRVDVVDMYDSDHIKVSPMEVQAVGKTATNESNDFLMLGKTPVWAIAHCLERIGSDQKRYTLDTSSFEELGRAANDAFLIEGILNVKNPPEEINERNKHIPCGPKMNYVKEVKSDFKVEHVSILLYVPSIGRFFSPNVSAKTPRLDAFAAGGIHPGQIPMSKFLFHCHLLACVLNGLLVFLAKVVILKNLQRYTRSLFLTFRIQFVPKF